MTKVRSKKKPSVYFGIMRVPREMMTDHGGYSDLTSLQTESDMWADSQHWKTIGTEHGMLTSEEPITKGTGVQVDHTVLHCTMTEPTKLTVLDLCEAAFTAHTDNVEIAAQVKTALESALGGDWVVLVGRSFGGTIKRKEVAPGSLLNCFFRQVFHTVSSRSTKTASFK